jgi:hypothetical protein
MQSSSDEIKPLKRGHLGRLMKGEDFTVEKAIEVDRQIFSTLGKSDSTTVVLFALKCPYPEVKLAFRKKVFASIRRDISKALKSSRIASKHIQLLMRTMTLLCQSTAIDLTPDRDIWLDPETGFTNLNNNLVTLIKKVCEENRKNGLALAKLWR